MKILILTLILNVFNIFDKSLYDRILPDVSISDELGNYTYTNNFEQYFERELKVENDFARSFFNDFLFDGNNYYVAGAETKLREEDNISSLDAVIYKLDENGTILDLTKMKGSEEDYFSKIANFGATKIIAAGITKSSGFGDFTDNNGSMVLDSGFISLFDNNLNLVEETGIGSFYDVSIEGILEHEGLIYLLFNHVEFGKRKNVIQIYDNDLRLLEDIELDLGDSLILDMKIIDDKLYLAGKTKDRKYVGMPKDFAVLFKLNLNFEVEEVYTYLSSNASYFSKIYLEDSSIYLSGNIGEYSRKIDFSETKLLIAKLVNNTLVTKERAKGRIRGMTKIGDEFYLYGSYFDSEKKKFRPSLYIMNSDLEITKDIKLRKDISGTIVGGLANKEGLNLIMNTKTKKSETELTNASLINLKKLKIREDIPYYYGTRLDKKEAYYLDEFNENLYGTYYLYDHYFNKYFNVYNNFREKKVKLSTNMEEKIYRDAIRIRSNAIMELDGIRIPNDYYIDQDGLYTLNLYGCNGAFTEISFEIVMPKEIKEDIEDNNESHMEDSNKEETVEPEIEDKPIVDENQEVKVPVPNQVVTLPSPGFSLSMIDEKIIYYLGLLSFMFLLIVFFLIMEIKH